MKPEFVSDKKLSSGCRKTDYSSSTSLGAVK